MPESQGSQGQNTEKSTKQNMPQKAGGASTSAAKEAGSQLDHFVQYMKENWRPILSDLVAAGVTAYMVQSAKDKEAKN